MMGAAFSDPRTEHGQAKVQTAKPSRCGSRSGNPAEQHRAQCPRLPKDRHRTVGLVFWTCRGCGYLVYGTILLLCADNVVGVLKSESCFARDLHHQCTDRIGGNGYPWSRFIIYIDWCPRAHRTRKIVVGCHPCLFIITVKFAQVGR